MSLPAGTRLGPYEIIEPIGAGGMGEVYRAVDTRLNRTVAVKTVSGLFGERFEREARAISALNHPHICTLHDVGQYESTGYLVMEFVDGRPLRGPLPLDRVLRHGIEICQALETAHASGIVHRDLKPSNILATKQGIKLLDFGLAKLRPSGPKVAAPDDTAPEGLTTPLTVLGTPRYMSPEQIEGKDADPRTDLFAFGCVLYELLTGKYAFEGASPATIMAAILTKDPAPIKDLQPAIPAEVEWIIGRCLAKDPDDRWQTARDLRAALERAQQDGVPGARFVRAGVEEPSLPAEALAKAGRNSWPVLLIVGAALIAVAALAAWTLRGGTTQPPAAVTRLSLVMPPGVSLSIPTGGHSIAVSPDGRRVAYVGERDGRAMLYVHALDAATAVPLANTDGASSPAFSPDGQSLVFVAGNTMQRIPVTGGLPVSMAGTRAYAAAAWTRTGDIVFGSNGGPVHAVPENGGQVRQLTTLDRNQVATGHLYPHVLDDSGTLLFGAWPARTLMVQQPGKAPVALLDNVVNAAVAGDSMLFGRDGALWAAPFDSATARLTGSPRPVLERLQGNGANTPMFAVTTTGMLVYAPGAWDLPRTLVWVDRAGKEEPIDLPPHAYTQPRLSADGRVAVVANDGQADIWTFDLGSAGLARLTFDPIIEHTPVWSKDGKRVLFTDPRRVLSRASDGSGSVTTILETLDPRLAGLTPDGNTLLMHGSSMAPDGRRGVFISTVPLTGPPRETLLFAEPGEQRCPALSPDGRWLAYESTESGQPEVYVRPFPDVTGGRWKISSTGGMQAVWSRDGRELFYRSIDGRVLTVTIGPGRTFDPGSPTVVVAERYWILTGPRVYDVSRDGQRFLLVKSTAVSRITHLNVVLDWNAGR